MQRFDAQVLAYCQMGNHYHLVLHTRQANLSRLMRHLNGVYTQAFNRRHGLVGHLFRERGDLTPFFFNAQPLSVGRFHFQTPHGTRGSRALGRHATDPRTPGSP